MKKEDSHKRYKDKEKRREYLRNWYRAKRRDLGMCRECKRPTVTTSVCEFHREKRSLDGIFKRYGLTKKEYLALGINCMICGTNKTNTMRLHVDHDHKTGKVRGILCNNCNNGLGRFNDNPELLFKALEYLQDKSNLCGTTIKMNVKL